MKWPRAHTRLILEYNEVTLKMRSWPQKSNHFFTMSKQCISASLLKFQPLIKDIVCTQAFYAPTCWFVCVEVLRPSQPNGVTSSAVSLPNHTFTGQALSSKRLTSIVHILSPETDNCPSWISGRERMTVENISWSISTKECCRPRQGSNPRPPGLQSDAYPTEPPRPAPTCWRQSGAYSVFHFIKSQISQKLFRPPPLNHIYYFSLYVFNGTYLVSLRDHIVSTGFNLSVRG